MPVGSEACLLCCSIDGGGKGCTLGHPVHDVSCPAPTTFLHQGNTGTVSQTACHRVGGNAVLLGDWNMYGGGATSDGFQCWARGFHWTWPASRPSRRCLDGRAICFGAMPSKSIHAVREFLETHSAPWHEYAFSHMDTRRDCRCSAICM